MAPIDHSAPRNRLLAALPPDSLAQLWPHLREVELPFRGILQEPNKPMPTVYFPESGWISMLAYLENGDGAEVGLVGKEGMIGLPVLLGDGQNDFQAMVLCQGTALSLSADGLRRAVDEDQALRSLLLRYALVHHGQVARTAACNGRHQINERLARWLLMAHDRAEGNQFPMTHELLSIMLGVRRAGISVAASTLQKAHLIRYERGLIEVTDRLGLENVACECYGIVRRASDRLIGSASEIKGVYQA